MANSIVALTDTASQVAELQRRQKLAEALSAQGAAPIEVQSYKGIQAPISPFSALAKVLQTYLGAKQSADAIKGEKEARQTARDKAVNYFKDLGKTVTPDLIAPTGAPEMINTGVPTADFTSASGSLKDMRKQLGTTPDEIAAAKNFVPPTQPVQVAQPPIMQAPGIDGSMAGAPMVRAVPGPVDNGPARMPMANAPSIQAPQLYGNEQAPVAAYTPQQKMAMLLEGSISGNPYVEKMAPSMYDALQTKITSDEDLARKIKGIDSLNLPPEQKQALVSAAAIGGAKGLETATSEVIKGQVGEHFVPAKPEDLAGYPKGTTGQISTITGKLTNVYNPSSDLNAAAQLKLSQARLRIEGAQLDISGQRLELDKAKERRLTNFGITPEQDVALQQAVAEGRVDPTRINGRNAQIFAHMLEANPGLNMVNNHAFAVMMANPAYQTKANAATALPTVLENVRDAGKKLNFSKVQYIGKLQAFQKKQLNDPDFINYMNQRNDAVMTIANVMRATGATDKSIEMEIKAAPETMSPDAFDAWYTGQMASLQPRLEKLAPYAVRPPGAPATPTAEAGGKSFRFNPKTGKMEAM